MGVIYLDSLFFLNLAINYLILLATAKIAAVQISRWRIGLGALLGAGYAVLAIFPQFGFLATIPMTLVSGALMALTVFGGKQGFLRLLVIFFAVSAAFGGAVYAIALGLGGSSGTGRLYLPISLRVLVISFALCWGAMTLVFRRLGRNTGKLLTIEISHRGKQTSFMGLLDTGNSLTDPVSGGGVLVAELTAVASLFSPEAVNLLKGPHAASPIELFSDLQACADGLGFYLIPYTAVGVQSGFLLAFRPDSLRIDGKEKQGVSVAISPTRVSDGGRYTALVNGGIL